MCFVYQRNNWSWFLDIRKLEQLSNCISCAQLSCLLGEDALSEGGWFLSQIGFPHLVLLLERVSAECYLVSAHHGRHYHLPLPILPFCLPNRILSLLRAAIYSAKILSFPDLLAVRMAVWLALVMASCGSWLVGLPEDRSRYLLHLQPGL